MVPAKQFKVDTRPGQLDRKSCAATTKVATRLRVARQRNGPQEPSRVESLTRLFGDVRRVDMAAPWGNPVDIRSGLRVNTKRS